MNEKRTEKTMNTHQHDSVLMQWGQPFWEMRSDGFRHCSYCGSLHPDDALALMVKEGTQYSGSDWKYGWPHKFYIGPGKFYAVHLADATDDHIVLWNRVVAPILGVKYQVNNEQIQYMAVRPDWQTWGTIGRPDPNAPKVPDWFAEQEFPA